MAALAAAQAEMSATRHSIRQTRTSRASMPTWPASAMPPFRTLAKHGLSIHQVTKMNGQGMLLVTRLCTCIRPVDRERVSDHPFSDKPHIMGSAITYARRYSWAAITGIAAEEDEDGNAAQDSAKNGNALPSLPCQAQVAARRPSATATGQHSSKPLPTAQSAREVERLREEWVRDVYPALEGRLAGHGRRGIQ